MKAADRAQDEFECFTRSLSDLSERQQIVSLKIELLDVLERADDFERDFECLQNAADLGDALESLSLPHSLLRLQERLLVAVAPGITDPASQRRALKALRLELFEMRRQCHALDAFCRLLLRRTKAKGSATASGGADSQATP